MGGPQDHPHRQGSHSLAATTEGVQHGIQDRREDSEGSGGPIAQGHRQDGGGAGGGHT